MSWFDSIKSPKIKNAKKASQSQTETQHQKDQKIQNENNKDFKAQDSKSTSGLWKKCSSCAEVLQTLKLEENAQVCPYCDHHYRMTASERLKLLLDQDSFQSFGESLQSKNPLQFFDKKSYDDRLIEAEKSTGKKDGTLCGLGKIDGQEVAIAVMDFYFMGGSMGVVTGEKIAYAMDLAFHKKIPALVVSCSGGARMQEGVLSLMQLAKTSAARQRLREAGIPYISILTDPTTGGCAASYAMQGDINLAEPKALIGFAGPRVIEQSIRQSLPEGFQRAEFLREHGFVDRIVHRKDMKKELSFFVRHFSHN